MSNSGENWYVIGEDQRYLFISAIGNSLKLRGNEAVNNGVGLLDAICDYCYSNEEYKSIVIRNMKFGDLYKFDNGQFKVNQRETSESYANVPTVESLFDQYCTPDWYRYL